jgi:uncharacterized membrane protein
VVAANWDAIPGELRLAVHFALMLGVAALLWFTLEDRRTNDYFHDGALFVAAMLGLTFFGHLGQVYQTSSPLWQPLLAWQLLFSPLLLLFGRGWPAAGLWFAGILGVMWAHADDYGKDITGLFPQPAHPVLYWGLIASPPMIVVAMAAVMRGRSDRPDFWRRLEHLAMATILLGVSLFVIVSAWDRPDREVLGSVAIQSLFIIAAAGVIWRARPNASGMATAGVFGAAAVIHLGLGVIVHETGSEGPWIAAIAFIALWSAVAYAALFAQWRRMFQLAVGVIAIRVIILSFELSDDLLGSGVSLIVSGLVAIGVAWGSVRISKRYAPVKAAAA